MAALRIQLMIWVNLTFSIDYCELWVISLSTSIAFQYFNEMRQGSQIINLQGIKSLRIERNIHVDPDKVRKNL